MATSLAAAIADLGPFRLLTRGDELPVFAFTTDEKASFNVFDVSRRLKERGWLVPANTFPETARTWRCSVSSAGTGSRSTWPACS